MLFESICNLEVDNASDSPRQPSPLLKNTGR